MDGKISWIWWIILLNLSKKVKRLSRLKIHKLSRLMVEYGKNGLGNLKITYELAYIWQVCLENKT